MAEPRAPEWRPLPPGQLGLDLTCQRLTGASFCRDDLERRVRAGPGADAS